MEGSVRGGIAPGANISNHYHEHTNAEQLMPAESGLGRNILITGAGSLCSRLLGFARDAVLAWLFGASGTADALATALRLPYLIRRLYGEGALSLELTIHCVRARHGGTPGGDCLLALAVGRRVLVWGLVVLVLGLVAARPILLLLAPGLAERPDVLAEALTLFRICLPYIPAAGLAAVCMAVLHSREHFALPALTPTVFNIIVLLFAGVAFIGVGNPGLMVAFGVLCGGLIQWWVQMPYVWNLARSCVPAEPLAPGTASGAATGTASGTATGTARDVARGLPLGLLGAAAPQCIFLIAAALTSLIPHASLAALFYAERLLEFPLGVCGAAIGIAFAPRLAKAAAGEGFAGIRQPLGRALDLALLCNLPAAAGLMAVSLPLTSALFGHGAFNAEAERMTALLLCAYAPGLPAYAVSRPLLAACHALDDRRTPLYALAAGLASALVLGGFLMRWGMAGPPLGASTGLWVYAVILWFGVRRACSGFVPVSWSGLRAALCGSVLTWLCASWLIHAVASPFTGLLLAIAGGIGVYVLTVLALDAKLRSMIGAGLFCRDTLPGSVFASGHGPKSPSLLSMPVRTRSHRPRAQALRVGLPSAKTCLSRLAAKIFQHHTSK